MLETVLEKFDTCDSFAEVMAVLETLTPEQTILLDGVITAVTFEIAAFKNTDAQAVINMVDPDMRAEGFAPDAEFFGRLSREQLLQVSVEITPDAPIKKDKKPDMIAALLPHVQASGWLPRQLRTPSYHLASPAQGGEGGSSNTEQSTNQEAA
jgi:hypothetical protein